MACAPSAITVTVSFHVPKLRSPVDARSCVLRNQSMQFGIYARRGSVVCGVVPTVLHALLSQSPKIPTNLNDRSCAILKGTQRPTTRSTCVFVELLGDLHLSLHLHLASAVSKCKCTYSVCHVLAFRLLPDMLCLVYGTVVCKLGAGDDYCRGFILHPVRSPFWPVTTFSRRDHFLYTHRQFSPSSRKACALGGA